jgi:hypothetical protein
MSALVTLWHDGGAYVQPWRSVFERMAPASLPLVEARVAPHTVRQGGTVRDLDDAALEALTQAYRGAAGKRGAEDHLLRGWTDCVTIGTTVVALSML